MQLEAANEVVAHVPDREIIVTTPPVNPNYARLDQRVTGLETAVNGIASSIGDLGKKFDERSRTPWPVLLTGAAIVIGLVGVIGTSWKAPIDAMLIRQDQDLRQIRSDQVPRVEIDNLRASSAGDREDMKNRLDRLEDAVFVPRSE